MNKGVTLLEMMIVVAIMSILLSLAIPAYNKWTTKYKIQNDTKRIFAALNEARIKAFSEKRVCGIVWSGSNFSQIEIRCDNNNDGDINDTEDDVIQTIDLDTPFTDGSIPGVTFSQQGFGSNKTICTTKPEYNSEYNCVKVSNTRIKMGHYDGGACDKDHCVAR